MTDLILIFGAVALLLSAIGIYGMLAYLVIRRTRDIGIRIAVGARSRDVIWQVLKEAVLPLAMGLLVGAGVSVIVGRWTESLLFGVSAHDMSAMSAAGGGLLLIAVAAATIPAVRASRIDPLRASSCRMNIGFRPLTRARSALLIGHTSLGAQGPHRIDTTRLERRNHVRGRRDCDGDRGSSH